MPTRKTGVSSKAPQNHARPLGTKAAKKVVQKKSDRKGVARPRPVPVPAVAAQAQQDAPEGTYQNYPILAELPGLIARQQHLRAKIRAIEQDIEQEKALREEIEVLLLAASVKTVVCGDFEVEQAERSGQKKISPEKLLEAGVDIETIQNCTVTGEPTTFVQVKPTAQAKARWAEEAAKQRA